MALLLATRTLRIAGRVYEKGDLLSSSDIGPSAPTLLRLRRALSVPEESAEELSALIKGGSHYASVIRRLPLAHKPRIAARSLIGIGPNGIAEEKVAPQKEEPAKKSSKKKSSKRKSKKEDEAPAKESIELQSLLDEVTE